MAYERIKNFKKAGHTNAEAVNLTSIDLAQAAEVFTRAFCVKTSFNAIKNIDRETSTALAIVIKQLIELYAIDTCFKLLPDLIRV